MPTSTNTASPSKLLPGVFSKAKFYLPIRRAKRSMAKPGSYDLRFHIAMQEQTYWCWAAVSQGIAHFYDYKRRITQSYIASKVLNRDCNAPFSNQSVCNRKQFIEDALQRVGRPAKRSDRNLIFFRLANYISKGHPMPCRIQWAKDQAGHFIVTYGYQTDYPGRGSFVFVADPWDGYSDYSFRAFVRNESFTWTNSYFL